MHLPHESQPIPSALWGLGDSAAVGGLAGRCCCCCRRIAGPCSPVSLARETWSYWFNDTHCRKEIRQGMTEQDTEISFSGLCMVGTCIHIYHVHMYTHTHFKTSLITDQDSVNKQASKRSNADSAQLVHY